MDEQNKNHKTAGDEPCPPMRTPEVNKVNEIPEALEEEPETHVERLQKSRSNCLTIPAA